MVFAENPDASVATSLQRAMVAAFAAESLCAPLELRDLVWPPPTHTLQAPLPALLAEVQLFGADAAGMRRASIGVRFRWSFERDDTFLARHSSDHCDVSAGSCALTHAPMSWCLICP